MGFLGRLLAGALIAFGGLYAMAQLASRMHAGEAALSTQPSDDCGAGGCGAAGQTADIEPAPEPVPAGGVRENAAAWTVNQAGLDIIRDSEGLRLEAYELHGRWYIGYGHSATAQEGMRITEEEAEALLRSDVGVAEAAVRGLIRVPVTRNEFSAMVSLAYNLGGGNFSRSAVVTRLNDGDRSGAADAFMHHNRAGFQVLQHLTHRRERERALFLS